MKIGLTLSGGGIRGAAHIGVIKALEEENIKIDIISGTSSGSIVASLYAMGYTTDQMLRLFSEFGQVLVETNARYFINHVAKNRNFFPEGTRSGENIEFAVREIAEYKDYKLMNQIKMPIAIPAVDLRSGKEIIFTNVKQNEDNYISDIEICKAVRASCSFPGIYAPCMYKEYCFSDGGILDNIPIKEAKKLGADKVIVVQFEEGTMPKKNNMYTIIMRSLDIMSHHMVKEILKEGDHVLNIGIGDVGLLDIRKIEKCYKAGYEKTKEEIDKIKMCLSEQSG